MGSLRLEVLGPLRATLDGVTVDLGAPRQRAVLAALARTPGAVVGPDELAELVWAEPPAVPRASLQAYVAGLRRALEPGRAAAAAQVVVTTDRGYALHLPPGTLDAARFEAAVVAVRRRLPPADDPLTLPDVVVAAQAVADLDEALGWWRGRAFDDLGDVPGVAPARARLDDLRLLATEDRCSAGLALGRAGEVAAEAEALVTRHPLRERLWALWVVALVRSGRQSEALAALARVRRRLDDELGVEPGPALRALQVAVLRQDPRLVAPPAGAAAAAEPWPLVGRDPELAALLGEVRRATRHGPRFATVWGEPGIGKTRLAREAAAAVRAEGVRVAVGRCGQDDGAPPLRPWEQVLHALGTALPDPTVAGASDFAYREAVADAVLAATRSGPVLVVLDDVQWADPASLRVLRLLVEGGRPAPVAVVLTWRAHPPPTGLLADLVEQLARHHALRVELTGLSAGAAAEVLGALGGRAVPVAVAQRLRERTDGNPFYLVEFARLAADDGDPARLDGPVPTAVHDVVRRRLQRLPASTGALLRAAAVLGRRVDLALLTASAGTGEEEALDDLDRAVRAGLLREEGVDAWAFAHGLVRDAAYAEAGVSRRARLHARAAVHLDGRPGREAEAARHWAAAGPAHAGRAWRAGLRAAEAATRVHAHEQALTALDGALAALDADDAATGEDRHDLLLARIDVLRHLGAWADLVATAHRAIGVARGLGDGLGDVDRLARAAAAPAQGAFWLTGYHGSVDALVVGALREALDRLPDHDAPLRARVMLALATELYYTAAAGERLALVDEALAMADRLGDEPLALTALLTGCSALWVPATLLRRRDLAARAVGLARRLGAEPELASALAHQAATASEAGDGDQVRRAVDAAREIADRLRLPYLELVLASVEISWPAMRGEVERVDALVVGLLGMGERLGLPQARDTAYAARAVAALWREHWDELVPMTEAHARGPLPVQAISALLLLRAGRADRAAALLAERPIDLTVDDWLSLGVAGAAAEVALGLDDPGLAAAAYARLAPYAGRMVQVGGNNALGPVDAFLALAARAVGERAAAGAHADRAAALIVAWRLPLVAQWLDAQRRRHSF